ncbi:MAG: proline--tRNA ligase [Nitrospirae bacterium]|nr:proline--tRNA ligase [Nitrospirota bacterium]
MKASLDPVQTLHEEPAEAEVVSHRLMLRAGLVRKLAGGVYSYLPMAVRALRKVEAIIRQEMEAAGAQEVLLPALQPSDLWEKTDRWKAYGPELFRVSDRHERSFALGPTHEEVITDLVSQIIRSYRQLPFLAYQIQTKFRDERRPRFGMLRGREFIMKDAYSFSASEADAHRIYARMQETYARIFRRLGLEHRMVEADSGLIGGNLSHEFMIMADSGEDTVISCEKCVWASNIEKAPDAEICPVCGSPVTSRTAIEVGHVFYLAHKYSAPMGANFLDAAGKEIPFFMGCYGIGVSRILAAAIEQSHDGQGIVWPVSIAPYRNAVLPLGPGMAERPEVLALLDSIESLWPGETYFDDREVRPGMKFQDADLRGFPFQVILGERHVEKGNGEVKIRRSGERIVLPLKDIPALLSARVQAILPES